MAAGAEPWGEAASEIGLNAAMELGTRTQKLIL